MPFQIFISHAEEDSQLAFRIYLILERMGLNPWEYKLHPEPGRGLDEIVRDRIKECEIFIPLLTSNGIQSQWVNQEIGVAYGLNRYIIPVVEAGKKSSGFIEFKQRISYYPSNVEETIYELIYSLRILMNPSQIVCKCKNCGDESPYELPDQKLVNQMIQQNGTLTVPCTKCNYEIILNPKTFEVI